MFRTSDRSRSVRSGSYRSAVDKHVVVVQVEGSLRSTRAKDVLVPRTIWSFLRDVWNVRHGTSHIAKANLQRTACSFPNVAQKVQHSTKHPPGACGLFAASAHSTDVAMDSMCFMMRSPFVNLPPLGLFFVPVFSSSPTGVSLDLGSN